MTCLIFRHNVAAVRQVFTASRHPHGTRLPVSHAAAEAKPKHPLKPETRLVTAGRDPQAQFGFVNPPVYHASTVLYPNAADQVAHRARYQYGRRGTPTSEALESAIAELDRRICELEAAIGDLRSVKASSATAGRKTSASLMAKGAESVADLDEALRSLSVEQRIAVKSGLMRAGVL